MRIITEVPYLYCYVKYIGTKSKSKYGDRIYTAWPTYNDCPAYKHFCEPINKKPKNRYKVAVIDRSDQQIKILDMSLVVYDQINVILEELKETTGKDCNPTQFDINVKFNSKSSTPNGYYHTMNRPPAPFSEADKDLINLIGMDKIEQILDRSTSSPKPEMVLKRMQALGWTEEAPAIVPEKGVEGGELVTPDDDDYSFASPSVEE
jgi:hypothetical protein